jgi:hypothetical protein
MNIGRDRNCGSVGSMTSAIDGGWSTTSSTARFVASEDLLLTPWIHGRRGRFNVKEAIQSHSKPKGDGILP